MISGSLFKSPPSTMHSQSFSSFVLLLHRWSHAHVSTMTSQVWNRYPIVWVSFPRYVTSNHRCGKMNYRPFITQSFCRLEMCALDWFSQVQVKVSSRLGSWQKPLASPLVNWSSGVTIMRMLKEAHCLMHRGLAEGVSAYLKNCFKQHLD